MEHHGTKGVEDGGFSVVMPDFYERRKRGNPLIDEMFGPVYEN